MVRSQKFSMAYDSTNNFPHKYYIWMKLLKLVLNGFHEPSKFQLCEFFIIDLGGFRLAKIRRRKNKRIMQIGGRFIFRYFTGRSFFTDFTRRKRRKVLRFDNCGNFEGYLLKSLTRFRRVYPPLTDPRQEFVKSLFPKARKIFFFMADVFHWKYVIKSRQCSKGKVREGRRLTLFFSRRKLFKSRCSAFNSNWHKCSKAQNINHRRVLQLNLSVLPNEKIRNWINDNGSYYELIKFTLSVFRLWNGIECNWNMNEIKNI